MEKEEKFYLMSRFGVWSRHRHDGYAYQFCYKRIPYSGTAMSQKQAIEKFNSFPEWFQIDGELKVMSKEEFSI